MNSREKIFPIFSCIAQINKKYNNKNKDAVQGGTILSKERVVDFFILPWKQWIHFKDDSRFLSWKSNIPLFDVFVVFRTDGENTIDSQIRSCRQVTLHTGDVADRRSA